MKVYLLDDNNCFKGIEEINPLAPLPRCTTTPPPETVGEQVAYFIGNKWVVLDSHPTKPEPTMSIPQSLTPRQVRMILTQNNLRELVETTIANSTDYDLKDWWEYSLDYKRDNEILISFGEQIGLTPEQIDTMFIEGAKL